jgi:hypothetical protein
MKASIRRMLVVFGASLCLLTPAPARSEPPTPTFGLAVPKLTVSGVRGSEFAWADPAWPLAPLHLSLEPVSARYAWNASVPMYRGETLWLRRGPLSLLSFDAVEESGELECALGCRALVERTLGVEARLNLGGAGAVQETYAFARAERVWSRGVNSGRIRLGFGGILDF